MENQTNSGALFKNDKGDNPKRPDYKGTFTDENGKEFWVSAWVKKDKKDQSYMSFTTQAKEPAHAPKTQYSAPIEDGSDKLPF